ncbi:MAG: FAD-dependent oxidoreductase [Pseudomonadota bacterium]
MKIAIVGSGRSGLSAAWALSKSAEIVLYEKDARLGGHTNTVDVDYDGAHIAVDTGFIVYNEPNYPNLKALFAHLGVQTQSSDMAFSLSRVNSLEWSSDSLKTIFTQKRNIFSPKFIWMLTEILRFNRQTAKDLDQDAIGGRSLREYLEWRRFGPSFCDDFLLPMGAAIWSTPRDEMLDFPAQSFLKFFSNHRLNAVSKHMWRTVAGGARNYIDKLTAGLEDRIRLGCGVVSVRRGASVEVTSADGRTETFDHVVFACHTDQALSALADPSALETRVLSAIRYAPNRAILHRDPSLMPQRRLAWASWNYLCEGVHAPKTANVSLTYYMNRLQNIDRSRPLFVTLNPRREPRADLVFDEFDYDHPQFDAAALDAQRALPFMQGVDRTWFAGAYCGYGFHEDGLAAGLRVATALGAELPWALDESRLSSPTDRPSPAYADLIQDSERLAAQ